jgi:2'-5' RNA ligase
MMGGMGDSDDLAAAIDAARSNDPTHFAYVPDETDPSTWRLPLYGADGRPVPKLVSYARGRLSPDADPGIPPRRMREVRARIATAWSSLHPGEDLPAPLSKADTFSTDQVLVQPSGVMIAFGINSDAAQALVWEPTGETDGITVEPIDQLHLTLAYLGDAASYTDDDLDQVAALLGAWTSGRYPLTGQVAGGAIFTTDYDETETSGAAVVLADVPGLAAFRTYLSDLLDGYGFPPVSLHDFQPHVTLAYGPVPALSAATADRGQPPTVPLLFDSLLLVAGLRVWRFPLTGLLLDAAASDGKDAPPPGDPMLVGVDPTMNPVMTAKADGEKRITYAPLYAPNLIDAHGEWMDADTLEAMIASYLACGDLTIRLQHVPMTVAGTCIGIMCWPWEWTGTLVTPDGVETSTTFPPYTAFQAVQWTEWAWAEVKAGRIRGYSFGGMAYRVDGRPGSDIPQVVDMPEAPAAGEPLPELEPVAGGGA